jgi:hypothetical protein
VLESSIFSSTPLLIQDGIMPSDGHSPLAKIGAKNDFGPEYSKQYVGGAVFNFQQHVKNKIHKKILFDVKIMFKLI